MTDETLPTPKPIIDLQRLRSLLITISKTESGYRRRESSEMLRLLVPGVEPSVPPLNFPTIKDELLEHYNFEENFKFLKKDGVPGTLENRFGLLEERWPTMWEFEQDAIRALRHAVVTWNAAYGIKRTVCRNGQWFSALIGDRGDWHIWLRRQSYSSH